MDYERNAAKAQRKTNLAVLYSRLSKIKITVKYLVIRTVNIT